MLLEILLLSSIAFPITQNVCCGSCCEFATRDYSSSIPFVDNQIMSNNRVFTDCQGDYDDPTNPDDPEEPYEIYGNDETSSFGNAISVNLNTQYDGYIYNFRNDVDYYSCYLQYGQIINVNISDCGTFKLYKNKDNINVQYYNEWYESGVDILIDYSSTYYFVFKNPYSYPIEYTFTIYSVSSSSYENSSSFVKVNYDSSGIKTVKMLSKDYSTVSSSYSHSSYVGSCSGVTFSTTYSGSSLLRNYYSNTICYFGDVDGIYDSNNQHSTYSYDDDRYISYADTFPTNSICHLNTPAPYNTTNKATAFFVGYDVLVTAAHTIFKNGGSTGSSEFSTSVSMTVNKGFSSNEYTFSACSITIPYQYYVNKVSGGNIYDRRQLDYCVIKADVDSIPAYYVHSYLGLSLTYDVYSTYYCSGFPAYHYLYGVGGGDSNCDIYLKNTISSSSIQISNGLIKSYIDVSSGQSGCALFNSSGYACGIVSGNINYTGNWFCPINKQICGLYQDYANNML